MKCECVRMLFLVLLFMKSCFFAEANEDIRAQDSETEDRSTTTDKKRRLATKKDNTTNLPFCILMFTPREENCDNEPVSQDATNHKSILFRCLLTTAKSRHRYYSERTKSKNKTENIIVEFHTEYQELATWKNNTHAFEIFDLDDGVFEDDLLEQREDHYEFIFNASKELTLKGLHDVFRSVISKSHESLIIDDDFVKYDMPETYLIITLGLFIGNDKMVIEICPNLIRKSFLQELLNFHLEIYTLNFKDYICETEIGTLKDMIAHLVDEGDLLAMKEKFEFLNCKISQELSKNKNVNKDSQLREISEFSQNLMLCFMFCVENTQFDFYSEHNLIFRIEPSNMPRFFVKLQYIEADFSVFYRFYQKRCLIFQPTVHIDLIKVSEMTNTSQYDLIPSLMELFTHKNELINEYLESLMIFWVDSYKRLQCIHCIQSSDDILNICPKENESSVSNYAGSYFKWLGGALLNSHVLIRHHTEYDPLLPQNFSQQTSEALLHGFKAISGFMSPSSAKSHQKTSTQSEKHSPDSPEKVVYPWNIRSSSYNALDQEASKHDDSNSSESSESDVFDFVKFIPTDTMQYYTYYMENDRIPDESNIQIDKKYELVCERFSDFIIGNEKDTRGPWFLFGTAPNVHYKLPKSHLSVIIVDDSIFIAKTSEKFRQLLDITLPDACSLPNRFIFLKAKSLFVYFQNFLRVSPSSHEHTGLTEFSYMNGTVKISDLTCQVLSPLVDFDLFSCDNVEFGSEKIVLRGKRVEFARCTSSAPISLSGKIDHLKIIKCAKSDISLDDIFISLLSLRIHESFTNVKLHDIILKPDSTISKISFVEMDKNAGLIHGYTISGKLSWPINIHKLTIEACAPVQLVIKDYTHLEIKECIGSVVHSDCGIIFMRATSRLVFKSGNEPIFENVVIRKKQK